jgi:hypothetical protein
VILRESSGEEQWVGSKLVAGSQEMMSIKLKIRSNRRSADEGYLK